MGAARATTRSRTLRPEHARGRVENRPSRGSATHPGREAGPGTERPSLRAPKRSGERRRAVEDQLATASSTAIGRLPDAERLRAALMERAADIRRVLTRRAPEVGRCCRLITERLAFAPSNETEKRGYQFSGVGSYGDERLRNACPTSNGGPNGIPNLSSVAVAF